jgi:signal transduction histidine kinase
MLVDKGQDPREEIESAEAELDRLNSIFETILRISRIEAAGRNDQFKPFHLLPMLEDLAETFIPMLEERGQSLEVVAPTQPAPPVMGDERMLRQMIVNLLQNAMNHGAAGNQIGLGLHVQDGATVLEITDRGPGIPKHERQNVFDPFYRLDSSRTTGGSGLGLALVKAICERHGITIKLADNMPGLKVILTFPPHA